MMYLSSTVGAFRCVAGEAAMGTEEATTASSRFVLSFLPKSGIVSLRFLLSDDHTCADHNNSITRYNNTARLWGTLGGQVTFTSTVPGLPSEVRTKLCLVSLSDSL